MLRLNSIHLAVKGQRGFSMIEVLITIVIIAIGLLGLSGLQAKTAVMQMESYERAQALELLADMESRIRASRGNLTGPLEPKSDVMIMVGPKGDNAEYNKNTQDECKPILDAGNVASYQVCLWALAVKGASETDGGTTKVGAMLGGNGCIHSVTPTSGTDLGEYYVTVVWQGLVATTDLDTTTQARAEECAAKVSQGKKLQRAVSTRILIPYLSDV